MESFNLEWDIALGAAIIICGAVVILISILKTREISEATSFVPKESRSKVVSLLGMNKLLMIFFLFGYLLVALSLIMNYTFIGVLFVSLVFFFGAVFVMLGTRLHARMLNEIQKTIHGLVPICMSCKKVRRKGRNSKDPASWTEIESFVSGKTEAKFTHGLCPSCLQQYRDKF